MNLFGAAGGNDAVRQYFGEDARAVAEWESVTEDLGVALSALRLLASLPSIAEEDGGVRDAVESAENDSNLRDIAVSLWSTSALLFERTLSTAVRAHRIVADDVFSEAQLACYRRFKTIRDCAIAHAADLEPGAPSHESLTERGLLPADEPFLSEVTQLVRHTLATAQESLDEAYEEFDWNEEVYRGDVATDYVDGRIVLPNPDILLAGERRPRWGRPTGIEQLAPAPPLTGEIEGRGFPNQRTSFRSRGCEEIVTCRARAISISDDGRAVMVRMKGHELVRAAAGAAHVARVAKSLKRGAVFLTVETKDGKSGPRVKVCEVF